MPDDHATKTELALKADEPDKTQPEEFMETIQDFSSVVTPPTRIGPYRILQQLGEGGMGVVYEALQAEPVRRKVALKVIKLGMDTEQVVARFDSERQALALMDHPNIARVYDAGATDKGRPYFVMEYVKGVPITEYCDHNRLSTRERLETFIQVCEGVQHAHQKGIIHRDIKPSNVLVRDQDGKHVPKIIDFGIAKATAQRLTEKTFYTEMGQLIGTPEYMSPEQAEMSGMDIDTRTDVYLLGVLLYEMLVGELPFGSHELRKVGFNEFRRRVLEDEPPRPSTRVTHVGPSTAGDRAAQRRTDRQTLARALRGDLDWITMKALEKDRTRRYASASELAADVLRFLNHEPVLASPPSNIYRLKKFARRHQTGVGFGAVLFVLLATGAVILTLQSRRIALERDRANDSAAFSGKISSFMLDLFKESDPRETPGQELTVRAMLDHGVQKIDELKEDPQVQARLKHTMADAYYGLALYPQARRLAEDALRIRQGIDGSSSLDVADSMELLGRIAVQSGDFSRARELHEEALSIRSEILGPESLEVADALIKLVSVCGSTGEDALAEQYNDRAFRILEGHPGDPRLTKVITNRAGLLKKKGEYAAARLLLERVLEIRRRELGPNHQDVARALVRLADLHEFSGDYAAARPLHERALQIREDVFGKDHMRVASSLVLLAIVNVHLGERDRAEQLHGRALEIYEADNGFDNPFNLYLEARYAALTGNRAEALRFLREAVIRRQFLNADSLRRDPSLRSLHGDSEFDAILAAVGG